MAKLPDISALGQRPTPEPSLGVISVRGTTGAESAIGETLVQVGKQFGATANEWQRQLDIEKAKVDRIKAEDALNRLEDARLKLTTDEKDGFQTRRGSNAITSDFTKDYTQRFDAAVSEIANSLQDPEQKRLFQLRAGPSRRTFAQNLQSHVMHQRDAYDKQVFDGTLDTTIRAATSAWQSAPDVQAQILRANASIDDHARDKGWAPEMVAAAKLDFATKVHQAVIGQAIAAEETTYAKKWFEQYKDQIDPRTAQLLYKTVEDETQKTLFNGYQRVFIDNGNDRRTLNALERTVNADTKLDEGRKNILLGRIQGKIDALDRRAEMYQMRWERNVDRQINAINNITLQGFEPSAEQMAPLVAATKGTSFEPQVKQMIATANATRQFRLSSPREQEATITQFEQEARKDPTKFDLQILSRFKSIQESQQKAVKEDPITFAARQQLVAPDDPAIRPLDMSKPELLGPQLSARATLARGMQSRYGSPIKVLTKEESDQLVSAMKNAPAADRAKYLGALSRGLQDDPTSYRALLAQIRPDDPVTALAGARAADNVRDARGRLAADLMLRGQEILNPPRKEDGSPAGGKLWPMPKMADMELQFKSLEQDSMKGLPTMRSDLQQAAFAIYAAKTAEAGDTTGTVDSKRMRESFELAIGKAQRWNGAYTIIPHWSTPGQFRDGVKQRLEAFAASGLLDPEQARRAYDLPLELAGEGRYRVRSGDSILKDKQGRDVIIDLSAAGQAPTVRNVGTLGETPAGAVTGMAR